MQKLAFIAALGLTLSACETIQTTSGADYIGDYSQNYVSQNSVDLDIREIASIEPDLRFPARIGLARIDRGRLIAIPNDEGATWSELAQDLGQSYGEFIPVSPLVASLVNPAKTGANTKDVVNHIRRGAARQHLDYVLIYEVNRTSDSGSNALRVADLSVLGLFILPSRTIEAESTASAMLMDVRNGYPYATATAFADKSKITTAVGSRRSLESLEDRARIAAVDGLVTDIAKAMPRLMAQSKPRGN